VLVTPVGKVVGRHAGYADVAQLSALLRKAPATPPANRPAPTPAAADEWAHLAAAAEALYRQLVADLDRPYTPPTHRPR
jgi:hypothetical protein